MKLNLLIDADIVIYRAAAACEREIRYDDENHVLASNAAEVWDAVQAQLKGYREVLGDHPMHFALTGKSNFRRDLWDGYKGGRSRKPLCYAHTKQRMIDELAARSVDCLEADDLLGIWQTQGKLENTVIVSLDKDLKTIPGRVMRPAANASQEPEVFDVTETEADYNWLKQTLTGDVTDGYKGLPGCGPVVAEKLLARAWQESSDNDFMSRAWPLVVAAYEAKGLDLEDALLQARLARILRASDWDSANKKVKLWEP